MSEIISIDGGTVRIGGDDGVIVTEPIGAVQYANPRPGDQVRVYRSGGETIVTRTATSDLAPVAIHHGDRREVNKVLYVLMALFFSLLGVHRFLRGQVGLGILMILVGWATLGIWPLIDFIISLTKLSAYPGDNYVFTADGRWAR